VSPDIFLGVSTFVGPHMPITYRCDDGAGPNFTNGSVTCSDAPGLGVDIDEAVLGPALFEVSRAAPR
jgi:L-alanine-DL-glutamate epimerase-like enolase superfamily enzyme